VRRPDHQQRRQLLAEFDLLVPHPSKPRWFIEAVTVWGRDGVVKAKPRLLAAV